MTSTLMIIWFVIECIFALIVIISIIMIAVAIRRILRLVRDFMISHNKDNDHLKCRNCSTINKATANICEFCGEHLRKKEYEEDQIPKYLKT